MFPTKWTMRGLAGAAISAVWVLGAGCGPSVGSYCNKVCDCTGCNATEHEDCVDDAEDARKQAKDVECGGEFDAALACLNAAFSCENDKPSTGGCEDELEALEKCAPGLAGGIGLNACDAYVQAVINKYDSCGVTLEGEIGTGSECTPALAEQSNCFRPCIEPLDCKCIDPALSNQCTAEVLQPFQDCISGCL